MLNIFAVKAHIRKGHAHLGMKDTFKAQQAFEKALELDPNSVVSINKQLLAPLHEYPFYGSVSAIIVYNIILL